MIGIYVFFSLPVVLSPDVVGVGSLSDDWDGYLERELYFIILGCSGATSVRLSDRLAERWWSGWWWSGDVVSMLPVDKIKTDKPSWRIVLMEIDYIFLYLAFPGNLTCWHLMCLDGVKKECDDVHSHSRRRCRFDVQKGWLDEELQA